MAGGALRDWEGHLYPAETAAIGRASAVRRREFAAGRTAARHAMAQLGFAPVPLRRHPNGPVQWPEGLTGSISHGGDHVLAVVGRTGPRLGAVGVDLESHVPLAPDLTIEICRTDEDPSHAIRIFSAKEAAYKAQFMLTRTVLDFSSLRITLGPEMRFKAEFTRPVASFARGDCLMGCQALVGQLLLSVVRIEGAAPFIATRFP